jgi:hypothetical protein
VLWQHPGHRHVLLRSTRGRIRGAQRSLIVYEHLIDDKRRKHVAGLLMSLMMLIETQEGFDYTGADCCGWMREVGFRESHVERLTGIESMVVDVK